MSSLAVGRCRYGLMCNENGFLFDDGVVVRLGEDSFLCHTTSGGSDRVHGWMEEWLQTEWIGPARLHRQPHRAVRPGRRGRAAARARCWSASAAWTSAARRCPSWPSREGTLGGIPARVYRISFSGELSYEVAVPAARGQELWDALLRGRRGGRRPALRHRGAARHARREGLHHDRRRDRRHGDAAGPRARLGGLEEEGRLHRQAGAGAPRPHPPRPQAAGRASPPKTPPSCSPTAPTPSTGRFAPEGPTPTIGHVTSSYFSPTLGRSIAMALVAGGAGRNGRDPELPGRAAGATVRATVVDPVFLDPEGIRQNV